jgi:GNAT superfamily N-acetyltransferase
MSIEAEAVERAALEALHAAAPECLRADLGLRCARVGTALVSIAGGVPASGIVANRTIELGLEAAEREETVARIAALYREAGVERYFLHLHPEAKPRELGGWLAGQGLEKARGWMKFQRGREAPPEAETTLQVRPAGPGDGPAFGRIAADAFDLGEEAAPWLAAMAGHPGWRLYMTFDGETPAGTGGLFVQDGVGWLDWGATAPAFRRRGSQSALLRRRILDALDMGCRLILTETGEEVEGDPQHSYKNILRMGFREAYVRENYAPLRR